MLQPVIQFGTAIYGKSFSGRALNRFQKLMHVANPFSVQQSKVHIYPTDSSKLRRAALCNGGHTGPSRCKQSVRVACYAGYLN